MTCYGNGVLKTVRGTRESIDRTFDCPTCLKQTLCIPGGFCFQLNSTALHVFQNGLLNQPPVQLDSMCVPESLTDSLFGPDYLIFVKCRPVGARFRPSYQRIWLNNDGTMFEAGEFFTLTYSDNDYAALQDNFVIAPGHNDEIETDDFIVSILDTTSGNDILVQTDSGYLDLKVRVSNCDSVKRLHPGPVYNGDTLQVVVDCIYNEELTRQRLLLPASELRSGLGGDNVVSLHSPIGNDTVVFSPDNTYILYRGITQIILIKNSEPSATPGIVSFTGPIAQADFINDRFLLVSIPGQDRKLLDVTEFFSSTFDDGSYTLTNNEAFCPIGDCSPYVLNDNHLFLFAENSQNSFYLNLLLYNLSNPTAQPVSLGKTLKADSMEICFHDEIPLDATVAEVTVRPITTPDTTPLTTPDTTSLTTPDTTSLTTPDTTPLTTPDTTPLTTPDTTPLTTTTGHTTISTAIVHPTLTSKQIPGPTSTHTIIVTSNTLRSTPQGTSATNPPPVGTVDLIVIIVIAVIIIILIVVIVVGLAVYCRSRCSSRERKYGNSKPTIGVPPAGNQKDSCPTRSDPPIQVQEDDTSSVDVKSSLGIDKQSDYGSGSNSSSKTNSSLDIQSSGISLSGSPSTDNTFSSDHQPRIELHELALFGSKPLTFHITKS